MAHDTTINTDESGAWPMYNVTCAEGDYTTMPVGTFGEALDSATWHSQQNGGTVVNPER